MVTQVWGKCDSQDIIFAQNQAGRWEAAVPASPTGAYIIELWARDEAGNVGYLATVKLAFDTSKLCFRVEILEIGAGFSISDVQAIFPSSTLSNGFRDERIQADFLMQSVSSQVVKCEVCGF
jgi:hypothetical protein